MTTGNDELSNLGYNSSQPDFDFAPRVEVKAQDQADLPALERAFKVLAARKSYYNSTAAVDFGVDLTVENQMIINRKMLSHIQELETLLSSTIVSVREKMNERQ